MKIKGSMTPIEQFEAARVIIASRGFKIFTPNRRYFRQENQLIAATSFILKKLFLLQLRNGELVVRQLPPNYGDSTVVSSLKRELDIPIRTTRPLLRLTRGDPWEAAACYVTPQERGEFELLTKK